MKSVNLRLDDETFEKLTLACSNKQEFLLTILKDALERDVIIVAGQIRDWGKDPERPGRGTDIDKRVPVVQRDDSRRNQT